MARISNLVNKPLPVNLLEPEADNSMCVIYLHESIAIAKQSKLIPAEETGNKRPDAKQMMSRDPNSNLKSSQTYLLHLLTRNMQI